MVDPGYSPEVCCFCGSSDYRIIVGGPTVPIIACAGCGLMRQGWLPENIKNAPIFIDYAGGVDRFKRQKAEKEDAHTIDFLRISERLERFLPQKGQLLEVGCAMGRTLNAFRQKGWVAQGVEPEEWCCEHARRTYGLDVICSPIEESGLQHDSFDAILLLHVIEHVSDPLRTLKHIINLVKPGGYLVVETPRYDTPTFRLLRGRERSVIPDHLHYFTRKTMSAMCQAAGFELCDIEAVGRTVTLDRLTFYLAKFIGRRNITNIITLISDKMLLNRVRVYINLHDMMRLYLQKPLNSTAISN